MSVITNDATVALCDVLYAVLSCDYDSSSSVVSRAFSALCVHSKFGHHPHPLGYLCAKFRFCRGLHCRASPWRKIAYSINQSLNHSLTHPAYLMPQEPKLSLRNTSTSPVTHNSIILSATVASWWSSPVSAIWAFDGSVGVGDVILIARPCLQLCTRKWMNLFPSSP